MEVQHKLYSLSARPLQAKPDLTFQCQGWWWWCYINMHSKAGGKDTRPSPTCCHVKSGSSATKGVCISRREPSKLGSARAPAPLGWGVAYPVKTNPIPCVILRHIWSFCVKRCKHKYGTTTNRYRVTAMTVLMHSVAR